MTLGQSEKFDSINSVINKIKTQNILSKLKTDYHELNPILISKGSTLEVWESKEQIFKIKEEMHLSWGVFIGITYFSDNKPIKYIEIEKSFNSEEKKFDKTIEIFRLEYYYLKCNNLLDCVEILGERKYSSGDLKYMPRAYILPLKYARIALKK
jgi:hypothetical protein